MLFFPSRSEREIASRICNCHGCGVILYRNEAIIDWGNRIICNDCRILFYPPLTFDSHDDLSTTETDIQPLVGDDLA